MTIIFRDKIEFENRGTYISCPDGTFIKIEGDVNGTNNETK